MKLNDKKALFASIIASGLDDVNVMFLSFTLTSIIADLSLNGAEAGLIASITNIGMLFGGLVFGALGDKYHKFTMLKITVAIFSIATGLIFFTDNIMHLYILRFIAGIGVGGEYGIAIAVMAGIVKPEQMGRISSLNGIIGQVGSITSAIIAGLFLGTLGWRGLFLIGFAPLLFVAWMHFSIDKDAISDRGSSTADKEKVGSFKLLFANKTLTHQTIGLMIMTTVQIAGYFGMMNWLPSMIQTQLNISVSGSTTWMITTIIGMSIGMFVFGNLIDRIGPRLAYTIFLIMSAISVYLYSFASTPMTVLIGGAIVGFFVNGMFCGYGAVVTRLYPYEIRSLANNTILNVGRAVGGFSSVVIGYILDHSSITMVMLFLASLYIISLITMLTIPNLSEDKYVALEK
ncbi:MFS transporter [Aerococcaceae bacterium DSM 111176]|nr:MFS transporter [Aerococcaceae bacterium DSM 111176]